MEVPAKKMDKCNMVSATYFAKQHVQAVIGRAWDMEHDPRKNERLVKSLCIACMYQGGRVGGAAITSRPCMCCDELLTYSSTATDVLCLACATKHELCKQCGGDREMRERRRKWPAPDFQPPEFEPDVMR